VAKKWALLFLSHDQGIPYPERYEHDGGSDVVHQVTGKLFPQEQDTKQLSPVPLPLVLQICHVMAEDV
jgi:hypothetical protein